MKNTAGKSVQEENQDMAQQASPLVKEWSNPTAAGLVALAVICACFFAVLTGSVGHTALPLLGCWMIGGFVIQIVVALLDLKGGNHAGGNTFLFFSAFFMLVGGLEMFFKYNGVVTGIPMDIKIDGFAWSTLAIVLLLWTPAFFNKISLLSIIVALIDVALPIIALTDLGLIPKTYSHVAAWALLAAAIVSVYFSAAIVVNTAYGKKKYPIL